MALTSTTIETLSTTAVAESIALTDFLQPKINDNDREVSWDGFIYIYHDKACSKDKLKGRLAVQVKGKECKNLSRKEISYPKHQILETIFLMVELFFLSFFSLKKGQKRKSITVSLRRLSFVSY